MSPWMMSQKELLRPIEAMTAAMSSTVTGKPTRPAAKQLLLFAAQAL